MQHTVKDPLTEPALTAILHCFASRGSEQYGCEAVTQLQHALQCATWAESARESHTLVAACLLHDMGHLLHNLGEDAAERGIDDRHEYRGVHHLRQYFPAAVTEPVRLHVNAKRYLCATQEDYWESLSPASKRSLELQGGTFSEDEALQFIEQPHAKDAVKLRIWDDLAKDPNQKTPALTYFVPVLERCVCGHDGKAA